MPERTRKPASRIAARRHLTLSDHLRRAVAASGLSVYRIAKETGVDQSTLNKFLLGQRNNLRLDVADRLFRFFFQTPRRRRSFPGNRRRG